MKEGSWNSNRAGGKGPKLHEDQSFPALIPWKQTLLPLEVVGFFCHSWLRGVSNSVFLQKSTLLRDWSSWVDSHPVSSLLTIVTIHWELLEISNALFL